MRKWYGKKPINAKIYIVKLDSEKIPPEVLRVSEKLAQGGFEAYVVGGCVRDLLLKRAPKDWDIATNATPEQVQGLFENTFYTNEFGTVGVVNEEVSDPSLKVIEVTPYRTEGEYTDARRPESVAWAKTVEEDLRRRDFTINAMAYDPKKDKLLDLFEGQSDLISGHIRAVGEPEERFAEDALRILRAVRIATELNFAIEEKTKQALIQAAPQLGKISRERIRDELNRILMSDRPMKGLQLAEGLGLLSYIMPELAQGIGVEQNQAHSYDVFEHNLRSLQHAADKGWPLEIRLAALLHDVGKPASRRRSEEKNDWTFHGHEVVGARMTKKILENLKFSRETAEKVIKLVRWHMFFSDPEKVTLSAVRRIVSNVGKENIWDLVNLRICDRIGTGRPKEQPFRLRKYQSMIEQAMRDPISVGMLAIDGNEVIRETGEKPGPRIGWILHALLEEVLEDPSKNTKEYLMSEAVKLTALNDTDLRRVGESGKERRAEEEAEAIKDIDKKYYVS